MRARSAYVRSDRGEIVRSPLVSLPFSPKEVFPFPLRENREKREKRERDRERGREGERERESEREERRER